ncbi:MAG: hypothetical protein WBG27_02840 [Candidatus Aquilonibacter sp.]|jgi:hypothetical protein
MNGKWDTIPVWLGVPFASGILTWCITGGNAYIASGTFVGTALFAVGRIVRLHIKARANAHGRQH